MNLEDILNCLKDNYKTAEFGEFQQDVVTAALAQELILKAASLHKPKWINSEEQLPELERKGIFETSKNVLIYEPKSGNFWIAYLFLDESDSKYFWIIEDYGDIPIESTYWMPLPPAPKG